MKTISTVRPSDSATIRLYQNAFNEGFCQVFKSDTKPGGALDNRASSIPSW